jgi:predicted ATPase
VSEMGGGSKRETLAIGMTANVAARIQAHADPGTVVISSDTLKLVRGAFTTQDLGAQTLKGVQGPVVLHRALARIEMPSQLDGISPTTDFIGREHELMLIGDLWRKAQEGHGQAVLICGEAGIGKTRLLGEFRSRMTDGSHIWLEGRCSAYTRDSAFAPIRELQRDALGFEVSDPSRVKLARLRAGLETAGLDSGYGLPLLASLHGMAAPPGPDLLSPAGRRKRTIDLLSEWLLRFGEQGPVVALIEDAHWIDPSTFELVGSILPQIATASVLLIVTHRPDFKPSWEASTSLTPMHVSPLSQPETLQLMHSVEGKRELPGDWLESLAQRADGVPLYAEELLQAALERAETDVEGSPAALDVPTTLQGSLMARLDGLGKAKRLVQIGAIFGREFHQALLASVAEMRPDEMRASLTAAERKGFFIRRGSPPGATYSFRHSLLRDVAYEAIPRRIRRRLHGQLALVLISQRPQLVEAHPELVAEHLTHSGQPGPAATWWMHAAERARGRAENEEAIRQAGRGLAVVSEMPDGDEKLERDLELQLCLARTFTVARGYSHEETAQAWKRARDLSVSRGDTSAQATVQWGLANVDGGRALHGRAYDGFCEAVSLAEKADSPHLRAAGFQGIGISLFCMGRFAESALSLEQATERYEDKRCELVDLGIYEDCRVTALCWSSFALWHLGSIERSNEIKRRAIELANLSSFPYDRVFSLVWSAIGAVFRRDLREAKELAEVGVKAAADHGFPVLEVGATLVRDYANGVDAPNPRILEGFSATMATAASGNRALTTVILALLAHLQGSTGRSSEAKTTLNGALDFARSTGESFYLAEIHRLLGLLALAEDPKATGAAAAHLNMAISIARTQNARFYELRATTELARRWGRNGRRGEALRMLRRTYDAFPEGSGSVDHQEARALLEELA